MRESPLVVRALGALLWGIVKRVYIFVPSVALSILGLVDSLRSKPILIAPHTVWIALALVIATAVFLEYYGVRRQLETMRNAPRAVIEERLRAGRDLRANVQFNAITGSAARDAFAAWRLASEKAVRERAAPFLDTWTAAEVPLNGTQNIAVLVSLDPLLEALAEIARQL